MAVRRDAKRVLPAGRYRPHFAFTQADQDISFAGMTERQEAAANSGINTGRMFIVLKPLDKRDVTADQFIDRLRPKLGAVPGVSTFL